VLSVYDTRRELGGVSARSGANDVGIDRESFRGKGERTISSSEYGVKKNLNWGFYPQITQMS
jgi:hypothetical protein